MTRRERFLCEMDQVVPWAPIVALIEPYYPKAGSGTQPMPIERMLRSHFMQQWFNLSDPAMEDALYDSESMRRFAGIQLVEDAVPDASAILRFRHLLERHGLSEQIFALVRGLLEQKRLLLKFGTPFDATAPAALGAAVAGVFATAAGDFASGAALAALAFGAACSLTSMYSGFTTSHSSSTVRLPPSSRPWLWF